MVAFSTGSNGRHIRDCLTAESGALVEGFLLDGRANNQAQSTRHELSHTHLVRHAPCARRPNLLVGPGVRAWLQKQGVQVGGQFARTQTPLSLCHSRTCTRLCTRLCTRTCTCSCTCTYTSWVLAARSGRRAGRGALPPYRAKHRVREPVLHPQACLQARIQLSITPVCRRWERYTAVLHGAESQEACGPGVSPSSGACSSRASGLKRTFTIAGAGTGTKTMIDAKVDEANSIAPPSPGARPSKRSRTRLGSLGDEALGINSASVGDEAPGVAVEQHGTVGAVAIDRQVGDAQMAISHTRAHT